MRRLNTSHVGIDEGEITLFDHFYTPSPMWSSEGRRQVTQDVYFSENFRSPPSITLSLRMLDASSDTHLRMSLDTGLIGKDKFELLFNTWSDTKIARLAVSWTAIGEVNDPDEYWEL